MNALARAIFVFWLCLAPLAAGAETRVFSLSHPHPEEVLQRVRSLYGDKIRADLVQQRLVVIGNGAQLREIGDLLEQLDRAPQALRLTLREQPPADDDAHSVTYGTDRGGLSIDTVSGALVTLEYSQIAQQPGGNGWWITIENVPTAVSALMLQVQLQGTRHAQVLVSYSKEQDQQRRVFGNTVVGPLGAWLPLLPQPDAAQTSGGSGVTYSTGPKPGSQLYLRIDPIGGQRAAR